LKNTIFSDVTLCSPAEVHEHFRGHTPSSGSKSQTKQEVNKEQVAGKAYEEYYIPGCDNV
jgi:hypothetical protein